MSFATLRQTLPACTALLVASAAVAATAPTPATYVMKAGASDLYEQQSSRLVLTTTKDPHVREFASMMLKDHATSTSEVKAAAMKSGLKPKPPMLDPKQKAMIKQLSAAKGMTRDHVYHEQQVKAHEQALELQQAYAASGSAPALKDAAAAIVPVVQHHIEMLNAMPSS